MAASGTIDGGSVTTYGDAIASRITWTVNSQDVANNTSNVTVSLSYKKRDDATTYGTGSWTLKINGTTYTGSSSISITNSGYVTAFSKTVTITHNADGTKSFTIDAGGSYIPGTSFTNTKCSGTATLNQIARASTISVTSSVAIGGTATCTITAKNSSYYHTVTWKCGSATATTHTPSTAGSIKDTLTIPTAWASQISSATSGSATVTVQTYSNSSRTTKIGDAVSKTFTVTIPASYVPSGSLAATYSGQSTVSGTKYNLQNKTAITLNVTGGAGGTGSSVKSYTFKRGSTTVKTITSSSSTASYTETLTTTGSVTYSVVITDNRGRTTTKTLSAITVYAYEQPKLTVDACWRTSNSSTGAIDGSAGKMIAVKATFSCTAVGSSNNTATCNVTYKINTEADTAYKSGYNSLPTGTQKVMSGPSDGFSLEKTYNIQFTVTDSFGGSVNKVVTIPTAFVTLDFKAGGTGVAIGKIADTDYLLDLGVNMTIDASAISGIGSHIDIKSPSRTMRVNANENNNVGLWDIDNNGWIIVSYGTDHRVEIPHNTLILSQKMVYQAGDVIDCNGTRLAGCLTSNKQNVEFFIPLPKPTVSGLKATLSGTWTIRHADGGYIISGQTLESLGTVTATIRELGVYVVVAMTTASSFANNATIMVSGGGSSKVTLS